MARKKCDTDLTNCRFGKLVVLRRADDKIDRTGRKREMYECLCDCGNTKIVAKDQLVRTDAKRTISCGCAKGVDSIGLYYTKIHGVWNSMIQRCYNPNVKTYDRYGGRGICVCDEWRYSFKAFYEWAMSSGYDEKAGMTLDRINNDLGYSPNNCRWATKAEQANNRSSNKMISFNGETHNISEWATILNVNYKTLHNRLRTHNYEYEEIFNNLISH